MTFPWMEFMKTSDSCLILPSMKQMTESRVRDGSALFGIVAGFALLFPGFFSPELRVLIVPGFALLLPSLLYTMR